MSEAIYTTTDLSYAAFLKVAGVQFLGPLTSNGRVLFRFEPSDAMRELKQAYFNHNAKVDALTMAETIREMKGYLTRKDSVPNA